MAGIFQTIVAKPRNCSVVGLDVRSLSGKRKGSMSFSKPMICASGFEPPWERMRLPTSMTWACVNICNISYSGVAVLCSVFTFKAVWEALKSRLFMLSGRQFSGYKKRHFLERAPPWGKKQRRIRRQIDLKYFGGCQLNQRKSKQITVRWGGDGGPTRREMFTAWPQRGGRVSGCGGACASGLVFPAGWEDEEILSSKSG